MIDQVVHDLVRALVQNRERQKGEIEDRVQSHIQDQGLDQNHHHIIVTYHFNLNVIRVQKVQHHHIGLFKK